MELLNGLELKCVGEVGSVSRVIEIARAASAGVGAMADRGFKLEMSCGTWLLDADISNID